MAGITFKKNFRFLWIAKSLLFQGGIVSRFSKMGYIVSDYPCLIEYHYFFMVDPTFFESFFDQNRNIGPFKIIPS